MKRAESDRAASFVLARRIFSITIGLIFLAAFVSLGVQVRGLFGTQGIMPAQDFLDRVAAQLGGGAVWRVPTLLWATGAGDAMLAGYCIVGAVLSVAIVAGFAPGACTLVCWLLYLSLCGVGEPFLNFQWDALLLETALLAAFWLPWRWRPRWAVESLGQKLARWLLWWLLFRLMFESGVVKLTWNDETWSNLSALEYHFETQPLPLWTAWYAHHLPHWLLKCVTFAMFLIEIVVPFLFIAPRRWRHGSALAQIALQAGILATGNYAFFNWLTIALSIPLFDDAFFPARLRGCAADVPAPAWPQWRTVSGIVAASIAGLLTFPGFLNGFRIEMPTLFAELRSFNGYGLFRVMTTERPEIVIEGSNDGNTWEAYEFRWKPGDPRRRPALVAPHQPRVDWQMWFAALTPADQQNFTHLRYPQNRWFLNLVIRTLQGSPEVLAIYRWNPFPQHPPRAIRAVLYDYQFTAAGEDGWWKRERLGLYCPPISLGGK